MKGLSFSEPMVKAWMEGRKTVTRRPCLDQTPVKYEWGENVPLYPGKGAYTGWIKVINELPFYLATKPPYHPGETVYIKETWAVDKKWNHLSPSQLKHFLKIHYKADGKKPAWVGRWRSPRFMPEWASRSHARIVSVRPGRVQEITEEEAIREGVDDISMQDVPRQATWNRRQDFMQLWNKLRPGSWESNPWVWRIELERID